MSGRAALLAMALAGVASRIAAPAAVEDRFAAVDAHARAAPASSAMSGEELALYLQQGTRDEREKARAAFTWIAHNIVYDVSLRGQRTNALTVLRERRATCSGYAKLFSALAQEMGLEAEVISGHCKGRGYKLGEGLDISQGHAWNAVKIDGVWRLVDCTWGAGYLDDGEQFVRRFNDHYFLTPPEAFVWDHLPFGPAWQLLETPISPEDYLDRVKVNRAFFDYGLWVVSHRSWRIETGDSLAITIGAPPGVILSARLFQLPEMLPGYYTFTQREAAGYMVGAIFPAEGEYLLRVYASSGEDAAARMSLALEYVVQAQSGAGGHGGFAEWYQAFLANNCYLDRPMFRLLPAGSEVEFELRVPGATEVAVVKGNGARTQLERQGEWFSGIVWVESGDVLVRAKFAEDSGSKYPALLKYAVK